MLTEPREAQGRTSTFVVTPGAPDRLDLTTVYKSNGKRLHTLAIFTLTGDTLRYCVAPPGRPRPTAFATKKGDGLTLVVLKRVPEITIRQLPKPSPTPRAPESPRR